MNVKDLKCRPQVVAVIGEAYADYELQRVIDYKDREFSEDYFLGFKWKPTPQGFCFWDLVNIGKNPYEHGHEKPELSEITPMISDKIGARLVPEEEPNKKLKDELQKAYDMGFDKERSDGSTASYYELPEGATELQHLISHRNQNGQIAEIFRACYRYGLVSHSDMLRDAKKIKFYAQAEIERLEKLASASE